VSGLRRAEVEYERATSEHEGAEGELEGATREHIDETDVSGGAKRRGLSQRTVTCCVQFGDTLYIYKLTSPYPPLRSLYIT
jgi:hypothetical protein